MVMYVSGHEPWHIPQKKLSGVERKILKRPLHVYEFLKFFPLTPHQSVVRQWTLITVYVPFSFLPWTSTGWTIYYQGVGTRRPRFYFLSSVPPLNLQRQGGYSGNHRRFMKLRNRSNHYEDCQERNIVIIQRV